MAGPQLSSATGEAQCGFVVVLCLKVLVADTVGLFFPARRFVFLTVWFPTAAEPTVTLEEWRTRCLVAAASTITPAITIANAAIPAVLSILRIISFASGARACAVRSLPFAEQHSASGGPSRAGLRFLFSSWCWYGRPEVRIASSPSHRRGFAPAEWQGAIPARRESCCHHR